MNQLGRKLTDENGIFDRDAAEDILADCQRGKSDWESDGQLFDVKSCGRHEM